MVSVKIMQGDVLARLKELPDNSVHCVVTSPPYWGLRDYGIDPVVWGGEPGCEHEWGEEILKSGEIWNAGKALSHGGTIQKNRKDDPEKWSKVQHKSQFCRLCGAWRGSLGLEPTIELFVEHIVEIFREVRRVLRPDGVCFVNLGDSYFGGKGASNYAFQERRISKTINKEHHNITGMGETRPLDLPQPGLKPKDLCGVPWRVALALQADGWWLRSDVVWSKPNPMPESCSDRPTRSHEFIFILTKSGKYFWDQEAVRERLCEATIQRDKTPRGRRQNCGGSGISMQGISYTQELGNMQSNPNGRNLRSVWTVPEEAVLLRWLLENHPEAANEMIQVFTTKEIRDVWTIATASFPGEYCKACKSYYPQGWRKMKKRPEGEDGESKAICPKCGSWEDWVGHFATFGSELVKTCIKAGTSEHGVCPKCGAPWIRVVEKKNMVINRSHNHPPELRTRTSGTMVSPAETNTLGWRPSCQCADNQPVPATVCDIFGGAGTTGLVAAKMGRNAILIEIKPDYCDMAAKRINADLGMMVICST